MNTILLYIGCPIIVAAIIGLWTFIYRKFIEERPVLNLQISVELPAQKVRHDYSHILMWRYECTLKNISEYTARNISISEISYEGLPDLFENINRLSDIFNEQNHLDKNQEFKFEIVTSHTTKPDELMNVIYENNSKIYLPGLKINQPEKYFRPKRLDGFYLLIKYHNSKGVAFYTLFKSTKTIKDNKYLRKPPKID